ncbi:MAG: pseudaminic acid biosynthesis-associated methylase [Acidimicrobiales bacterium]|nr:pseudaminic acid biosynthesis-associated methylase [Acidimicrobiales bacterium]
MTTPPPQPPASELEALWAGEFGDAYVSRNHVHVDQRAGFWAGISERFPCRTILEIGPAHGENLRHLVDGRQPEDLWGLDLNRAALAALVREVPGANAVWGTARDLPFRDRWFDMVFTVGLLIHVPTPTLPLVMAEIVRTSGRFIMAGEYHSDEPDDIGYRGQPGVLVKRDFGAIYQELFPELILREEGFLTQDEHGFDRVTYQVFERP